MIAPNCVIADSDFHALWPAETRHVEPGFERDAGILIGRHVWIGMNSLVLKGVTIGDGAVVGAGSVVTADVPPRCIVAGVPAKAVDVFREREGKFLQKAPLPSTSPQEFHVPVGGNEEP